MYTTRVTEGFLTMSMLNIQISILLLGREIKYLIIQKGKRERDNITITKFSVI